LAGDVLPDVELGPVREREDADLLALADPAVVEGPRLGALRLRVPLTVLVAEREHALLGPRPLLVAAGAAEGGVEAVLTHRVEEHPRLEPVAGGTDPGYVLDEPALDRLGHGGHDQAGLQLSDPLVAELDHLRE